MNFINVLKGSFLSLVKFNLNLLSVNNRFIIDGDNRIHLLFERVMLKLFIENILHIKYDQFTFFNLNPMKNNYIVR